MPHEGMPKDLRAKMDADALREADEVKGNSERRRAAIRSLREQANELDAAADELEAEGPGGSRGYKVLERFEHG